NILQVFPNSTADDAFVRGHRDRSVARFGSWLQFAIFHGVWPNRVYRSGLSLVSCAHHQNLRDRIGKRSSNDSVPGNILLVHAYACYVRCATTIRPGNGEFGRFDLRRCTSDVGTSLVDLGYRIQRARCYRVLCLSYRFVVGTTQIHPSWCRMRFSRTDQSLPSSFSLRSLWLGGLENEDTPMGRNPDILPAILSLVYTQCGCYAFFYPVQK